MRCLWDIQVEMYGGLLGIKSGAQEGMGQTFVYMGKDYLNVVVVG